MKFLLEIGVEEIPDWMLVPAIGHLRAQIETLVGRTAEWAEATPRRLAVLVDGVAAREADQVQLVKGPPIAAAPQAVAGFAKKQGVTVEEMTQADGYWRIEKKIAGRDTAAVLSEKLPQLILGIPWPKTMLWPGRGGERFIRPIRWLVALLDETVVPFAINGVASANKTDGHRMMGAKSLTVTPETYESVLRENGVILRAADRRKKLLGEVGQDSPLLDLHVYLNEFPTAIRGSFDPAYLTLPEEVLVTVMRYHQKYFAVHDASGKLAPEFIAVMNRDGDPEGLIRHGHERVLRARFNDARFFYDVDQKKLLRDRLADLESVTFQAQLGNYRQKADRMVALCDDDTSKRAALLSKCDLTTDMVKEFTELQGIIGGRYAEVQGESAEVARAIYDHYKPLSMEDAIPATRAGQIVSLADKVDTLREFFRIGLIPSGSKDPFALRRAAQGVIRILAEGEAAWKLSFVANGDAKLREFLDERLRYYYRDVKGFSYDVVNAVMAAGWDDVKELAAMLAVVRDFAGDAEFLKVCALFKRVKNILSKENYAGSTPVNGALLETPEERALWTAFTAVRGEIEAKQASRNYAAVLQTIATLAEPVDAFFTSTMVNADDPAVRENRLSLLSQIQAACNALADFSLLVPA